MIYSKPALTIDEQVALLRARGMNGDAATIARHLESVSYYRLSAYWYTFRFGGDDFAPGTQFDEVWDRYVFDRALRILVLDALERVEVAVRTRLALSHGHHHGPFGYAVDVGALVPDPLARSRFLDRLREEVDRSRERFVEHFHAKYGDAHDHLPIWMATEVMTFGTMLSLYKASRPPVRKEVARHFGVADLVLESWLLALNAVRNLCAHHGRLWNRELGVKPKLPLPRADPDWYVPVQVTNSRVFGVMTILCYALYRVAPASTWATRVSNLLGEHPTIPIASMGFPSDWRACPIWKRALESPLEPSE